MICLSVYLRDLARGGQWGAPYDPECFSHRVDQTAKSQQHCPMYFLGYKNRFGPPGTGVEDYPGARKGAMSL